MFISLESFFNSNPQPREMSLILLRESFPNSRNSKILTQYQMRILFHHNKMLFLSWTQVADPQEIPENWAPLRTTPLG